VIDLKLLNKWISIQQTCSGTYLKPNLLGINMCLAYQGIQFIQNKFTKISYIGTLSKVWFMQDFCLFRVWFRQASLYIMVSYIGTLSKVWFMQDFYLFRVWFRQVSLYIMISYLQYEEVLML
jgi:hypothetical protein